MTPDEYIDKFVPLLLSILAQNTPKDTRNLVSSMMVEYTDDYVKITISGPTNRNYNYAQAVNDARAATYFHRGMSEKEARNFHFVERSIEQAKQLMGEM